MRGSGTTFSTPRGPGREEQALLLAAGLADLAVHTVGSAFGTLRGLLRRPDTADLAQSVWATSPPSWSCPP
ncbi:hypothetical protein [Streptomyces bobili]|uniref:hypothetical protein n=1 Tax=Streptomyces bobili TaxID=67280 RepID=UPI003F4DCE69